MNTELKEFWVHKRFSLRAWESLSEVERENFVAAARNEMAAVLARDLLKHKYIVAHDSVRRFDCDEPFVQLSASICVGYVQRTVWATMPVSVMLREVWARFWGRLW